jgi:2-C-methyl-D-erythritol 4-phosphate cytidylyltransferase
MPLNPVLNSAIECALKHGSGVVAVKARDTLINMENDRKEYLERNNIYSVQTPQAFKYKILLKSLQYAEKTNFYGTDESMLLDNANYDFKIVEGKFENFKITTDTDLNLYEKIVGST